MPRIHVPAVTDLSVVAPKLREAVTRVLQGMKDDGWKPKVVETLRTSDRQQFLFGKGRTPEQCVAKGVADIYGWPACPDGIVTNAPFPQNSWHGFGLAVDIAEDDATPWIASQAFWHALGRHAGENGLLWGGAWRRLPDLPHVQWAGCALSPSVSDKLLLDTQGLNAVWAKYRAT